MFDMITEIGNIIIIIIINVFRDRIIKMVSQQRYGNIKRLTQVQFWKTAKRSVLGARVIAATISTHYTTIACTVRCRYGIIITERIRLSIRADSWDDQ